MEELKTCDGCGKQSPYLCEITANKITKMCCNKCGTQFLKEQGFLENK